MVFPFWYTNELAFYKSEVTDFFSGIKTIVENNKGEQLPNGYYSFKGKQGFLGLPSFIKLNIETEGTTVNIKYFISLFESNVLFLMGLVLGIFLFINHSYFLAYLFFGTGVFIYVANAFILSKYLKNLLLPLGSLNKSVEEQELWEKQQVWTKNPEVCSACGEPVNPYAIKCVNCGMHFSKKNRGKKISSVSTTQNIKMQINFKKN